jgi:hypothetical protein
MTRPIHCSRFVIVQCTAEAQVPARSPAASRRSIPRMRRPPLRPRRAPHPLRRLVPRRAAGFELPLGTDRRPLRGARRSPPGYSRGRMETPAADDDFADALGRAGARRSLPNRRAPGRGRDGGGVRRRSPDAAEAGGDQDDPRRLRQQSRRRRRGSSRRLLATARIDHPHVVSAIDCGHLPGGGTYLVIQLVRGVSLWQKQEAGPLPWAQVCQIGASRSPTRWRRRTRLGIVHRDLKPENVLLETAGRWVAARARRRLRAGARVRGGDGSPGPRRAS